MLNSQKHPVVRDLHGNVITLPDLPKDSRVHWNPNNKAKVVRAVKSGLISLDEAVNRYALSYEEFDGWKKALEENGPDGLKVTRSKRQK